MAVDRDHQAVGISRDDLRSAEGARGHGGAGVQQPALGVGVADLGGRLLGVRGVDLLELK